MANDDARIETELHQRTLELSAMQQRLRDTEQRYQCLVKAITAIVWDTPASGEFESEQPGWSAFTGQTLEELLGWGWLNAVHPEDRPLTASVWSNAVASRSIYQVEHRLYRHDGTYRHMAVRAVPILNDDGSIREWVGVHADITEQKRAEQVLREAKEAAEAASRAKSEFLANMSHEIRTPMNGILGMTELLLDMNLAGDQREFLDIIKSSADSLLSIINDVLDFSKIEAGKLELDPVEFRLRDSLCDMLKPLALRAHKKGVELTYRVAPQVPDALRGDWNRVRQVLINLVGNAIKFTHQGETAIDVEADALDESMAVLHVTVRDTGIGIAPEKLEAVFAPFVQADGTMTRQYGGTGLGLAICSRLIEMMGGRIWAESELGKGSTFHFTVRLEVSSCPEPGPTAPHERLHGLTVLVVDDNETNRRILQELLVRWGMRPTLVDGGRAALAALAEASDRGESFQLILLDTSMPEMDGLTLAERIKADSMLAGITMLMLSSADRQEDVRRCRELGVGGYLTKPVNSSELLELIQRIMNARAQIVESVAAPEAEPQKPAPAGPRPMAILLVEDNLFNQRVAVAMLERQGHRVRVAENGLEALALLAKESFQLVLMDVQMPKMDGLEATAAIRSQECGTGRHMPVIALTAHAMKGDRERFLAAGMDGYVTKPIRPEELWQAIRQVLPGAAVLPGESPSADLPSEGEPVAVSVAAPPVDLESALARLGGKVELLREITGLFHSQCAKLMDQIGDAIRSRDAKKLQRAAHTLKGSVSFFGAPAAKEAAAQLEAMGQEGKLEGSPEVLARLIEEINRLLEELKAVDALSG